MNVKIHLISFKLNFTGFSNPGESTWDGEAEHSSSIIGRVGRIKSKSPIGQM